MENNNLKSYDPQKLTNFLEKVKVKLNQGIEEVGKENEEIITNWISELTTENKSITINDNIELRETNLKEIAENQENYKLILDNLENLSNENLSEKQKSIEFFEKNLKDVFSIEYSIPLENKLLEILTKSTCWLKLFSVFKFLLIFLSNPELSVQFNFERLKDYIINHTKEFINLKEFRFRQILPQLYYLLIYNSDKEINEEVFKRVVEIVISESVNNFKNSNNQLDQIQKQETHNAILIEIISDKTPIKVSSELIQILIDSFDSKLLKARYLSIELFNCLLLKTDFIEFKSNFLKSLVYKLANTIVDLNYEIRFISLRLALSLVNYLSKNGFDILREDEFFLKNILPKICLNRYIPADGIKNISIDLWKLLVGSEGIKIIKSQFVYFLQEYLIEMNSVSAAARESSIRSLQELIMKVAGKEEIHYFAKNEQGIINSINNSIRDSSWSVRETAFNALGYIFNVIKESTSNETKSQLIQLSIYHLFDCIYEVRDAAAYSLKIIFSGLSELGEYKEKLDQLENLRDSLKNSNLGEICSRYNELIKSAVESRPDLGFIKQMKNEDFLDGVLHFLKEFVNTIDGFKTRNIIYTVFDYYCRNHRDMNTLAKKTYWQLFSVLFTDLKKTEFIEYESEILKHAILILKDPESNSANLYEVRKFINKISDTFESKYIMKKIKSIDSTVIKIIENN